MLNSKKITSEYIAQAAITAALYVVFTLISGAFGLSSSAVQFRLSEAFCILPCFFPAAVPGLFIGCLISNVITGSAIWDIIFGSIATLIGALGTRWLRKRRFLAVIPPIMANVIIVPVVLYFTANIASGIWLAFLTVGIGEVVCVGILGELLYQLLDRHKNRLFKKT